MGEAREDHGNGVIRGERELRLGYIGFKFFNNSCENGVGQAVERSPLSVAQGGFHCPNVLRGESTEGGNGEF